MVVLATCKKEDPLKMKALELSQEFSHFNPIGPVALETEFWSNLAQNLMQFIANPTNASDEIWFGLACWSQEIFKFESVNAHREAGKSPTL